MVEYLQPILIALAVLAVPASMRFGARTIVKKLDEGRTVAETNAQGVAQVLEVHRTELLGELTLIKDQTTKTNGKVAEHDKELVRLGARVDVLMEMYLKGRPE